MRSKELVIAFFLLVISFHAAAQRFSSELWHEGRLVTFEGDTIRGQIKYDMEGQSVQVTTDGNRIQAFSPRNILTFELYDELIEAYRIFYILPYRSQSGYKAPFIFELSYEGPYMSLLRSENIELVVRSLPYMYSSTTREELVYTYYFLDRDGNIEEFNGKKSDINRIFRDRSAEMRRFIKDERLKLNRLDHLVRICSYYNSIKAP